MKRQLYEIAKPDSDQNKSEQQELNIQQNGKIGKSLNNPDEIPTKSPPPRRPDPGRHCSCRGRSSGRRSTATTTATPAVDGACVWCWVWGVGVGGCGGGTHDGALDIPGLPPGARYAHVIPGIKHSLLSIVRHAHVLI